MLWIRFVFSSLDFIVLIISATVFDEVFGTEVKLAQHAAEVGAAQR